MNRLNIDKPTSTISSRLGNRGMNVVNDLRYFMSTKKTYEHQLCVDTVDRSIIILKGYEDDSRTWFAINAIGNIIYSTGTLLNVMASDCADRERMQKIHDKALRSQLELTERNK